MSNTQKRIASALVLGLAVAACVYFGVKSTLFFILLFCLLAVDEIFCNLFKKKRFSLNYFISETIIIVPFIYFFFVDVSPDLVGVFTNAALLLNVLLIVYLFYINMESKFLVKLADKFPFLAGILILLPMMSLGSMTYFSKWRALLAVLLIVNFGMDTGAWFFGKNFGKHKLWPSVSPNKTIEGLIGGILTSGIVGGIFWQIFFDTMGVQHFLFFAFLGLMSQVGDLVQSKIKRQVGIKDSSTLIPGHGGVYDRIDSLIFLAPFFVTALKYFYIVKS
ncbi:MAG: phosphatidate cytidylyltransferase [Bacteriovoracaceae bacterium]|nr:phosphatidate cytidylyltransferase [Bacteriovoracaceae bacterium]